MANLPDSNFSRNQVIPVCSTKTASASYFYIAKAFESLPRYGQTSLYEINSTGTIPEVR